MIKKEKKILVYEGIVRGHRYITEKEMRDRKALDQEWITQVLKWTGITIVVIIIILWIWSLFL